MKLKWLATALILGIVPLLLVGRAAAQTVYTPGSLSGAMLTPAELSAVLSAVGSGLSVTDSSDGSPVSDTVVRATRVFKTDTGIAVVALFSNADGSAPNADEQSGVGDGTDIQTIAGGVFDSVGALALQGQTGAADTDQLATFTGVLSGNSFNTVADAFIKGNVFGVVLYATPLQNDGTILGGMVGAQVAKLS